MGANNGCHPLLNRQAYGAKACEITNDLALASAFQVLLGSGGKIVHVASGVLCGAVLSARSSVREGGCGSCGALWSGSVLSQVSAFFYSIRR